MNHLDLERGDGFLQLARQRRRTADAFGIQVAGKLLGQGRAALTVAADGMEKRGRRAAKVDTVMVEKAMVLGGDQRVDDVGEISFSRTHCRLACLNSASSLPSAKDWAGRSTVASRMSLMLGGTPGSGSPCRRAVLPEGCRAPERDRAGSDGAGEPRQAAA